MRFEKEGISLSLKNLLLQKNSPAPSTHLQEAFGLMERKTMGLKIIRGLCLARVPFNGLRNPEFVDMLVAVNKSTQRLQTSLL